MTSPHQPGPYGAPPPPPNPYLAQQTAPAQQTPPAQAAWQGGPQQAHLQPPRARRTSPAVHVLLAVAGTLLAPLGYLLLAKGASDRYRLTAVMLQGGTELAVPTLLLVLGVLLVAAVAVAAGWSPWAAIVPGALLGLAGLHSLVDPMGAYRAAVDVLGVETGNGIGMLAALSVPLLVSVLLLGAGVAGALGRRRGRRSVGG